MDEDILVAAILAIETNTITAALYATRPHAPAARQAPPPLSRTRAVRSFQIPNQPSVFAADPLKKKRSEDALIAFSWNQYILNPDRPEWVAYLPVSVAVPPAQPFLEPSRHPPDRWSRPSCAPWTP
jgi:hypothetical protein